MAIVDLSTELNAPAERIWSAVKTPAAFRKVTRGLLWFPVIGHRDDDWQEGETVIGWVFLFGFIPFSKHRLRVEGIDDQARTLSSEETGGLLKLWNHDIVVTAINETTCRYRDRIEIDAGVVTPIVVWYAKWFYRMRQRRWRVLAKRLAGKKSEQRNCDDHSQESN